ncbi:unnamed protein product [Knipowitschia caucasica]|uniref:Rho-GAP domain-containing protein n=1 Tax=Knipowitschia caucasica TaxID=637954 RepID=A0AAV2J7E8_KNICA
MVVLFAEIEAREACDWLKAAGFPQYAQLFRDGKFPIDLQWAKQDHAFLDSDAVDSLCRRLKTLNKSAELRLELRRSKRRQVESDDEDFCALSPIWSYDRTSRKWNRDKSCTDCNMAFTFSSYHSISYSSCSSDSDAQDHTSAPAWGISPSLSPRITAPSPGTRSSGCPSPGSSGVSLDGSLERSRRKNGTSLLRKIDKLKLRRTLGGFGRSLGSSVEEDDTLQCTDSPQSPNSPASSCPSSPQTSSQSETSSRSHSQSESSSLVSTPSPVTRVRSNSKRGISFETSNNQKDQQDYPIQNNVHSGSGLGILLGHKGGTLPNLRDRILDQDSVNWRTGSFHGYQRRCGSRRRNGTSSLSSTNEKAQSCDVLVTEPRLSIYDNVQPVMESECTEAFGRLGSDDVFSALDRVLERISDLQQLVSSWTQDLSEDQDCLQIQTSVDQDCLQIQTSVDQDCLQIQTSVDQDCLQIQTSVDQDCLQIQTSVDQDCLQIQTSVDQDCLQIQTSVDQDCLQIQTSVDQDCLQIQTSVDQDCLQIQTSVDQDCLQIQTSVDQDCLQIQTSVDQDCLQIHSSKDEGHSSDDQDCTQIQNSDSTELIHETFMNQGQGEDPRSEGGRADRTSSEDGPMSCCTSSASVQTLSWCSLALLQKLALLRLTALMDKYSPSSRQGWSWTVPKPQRKCKGTEVKGSRVFGVPLLVNMQQTGEPLPPSVLRAMVYLRNECLDQMGLFRKSGLKSRIQALREQLESGPDQLSFSGLCAFDVADLIKQYLRDLPEPLLSSKLNHTFLDIYQYFPQEVQLDAVQSAILLLPDEQREALRTLLFFLCDVVSSSQENHMTHTNMAVCLAPSLFHLSAGRTDTRRNRPGQRKSSLGPEQKELSENLAATQGLAHMISEAHTLFQLPGYWTGPTSTCSESDEGLRSNSSSFYGDEAEGEGLNECQLKLQMNTETLLKLSRDQEQVWTSFTTPDGLQLDYRKCPDLSSLPLWRARLELDVPPAVVLRRILSERAQFDPRLQRASSLSPLGPHSDLHQYHIQSQGHELRSIAPTVYSLLRSWQPDSSCGPLYVSSVSVPQQDVPETVRVHCCMYLLEPQGDKKTTLTHLCSTEYRGRSMEWHVKVSGHLLANELLSIRDSFEQ